MAMNVIDDPLQLAFSAKSVITVALFGRTGNGKSATGNSILGRKAFISKASSSGVTDTSEMQCTVLEDGQVLNVIDTPGLFDFSIESEVMGREIVNCIELAKDGIDAVLVVFSVRTRFTREEEGVLQKFQNYFGEKITNYVIVVFTGGDELEHDDVTLEEYIGSCCPDPLMKLLNQCKGRVVLFDNRTRDGTKKAQQVQQFLSLVNMVVNENGGQPYSNKDFKQIKEIEAFSRLPVIEIPGTDMISQKFDEQLKQVAEMVELKVRESTESLQKQLADEQAARLEAEKFAREAAERADEENRRIRKKLERAHREAEACRRIASASSSNCSIL